VRVQGEEAKFDIVEAIQYLNKNYPELEVLLVGRGGGSYEDLWAFNEEIVARAIAASKIPIISCVGHEVDFTIADFVADLRAPTPSAAAELVVKNKSDVVEKVSQAGGRLKAAIGYAVDSCESRLNNATTSRAMLQPQEIFEERMQQLDHVMANLVAGNNTLVEAAHNRLNILSSKINLLSPLSTVSRGYAICRDESNSIVLDSHRLQVGAMVSIAFKSGSAKATINSLDHKGSIADGKKA